MQASRGFQVCQFLAESIVSRVNLRTAIRIVKFCLSTKLVEMCSGSGFPVRTLDRTWGVPRIGVMLAIIAEQVCQLREVHVQPKGIRDARRAVIQSIGSDLCSPIDATIQVPQKSSRILSAALADTKRGDEFCVGVDCHTDLVRFLPRLTWDGFWPDMVHLRTGRANGWGHGDWATMTPWPASNDWSTILRPKFP
jgi:hypothetical protein